MTTEQTHLIYAVSRSYNCTVFHADSLEAARKDMDEPGSWNIPGDSARLVREATPEDIEEFTRSGGVIR